MYYSRQPESRIEVPITGMDLSVLQAVFSQELFHASPTYLLEADSVCTLTEALTADVEAVLADETMAVGADAAGKRPHFWVSIEVETFEDKATDQPREPLPYFLGRENHTDS